MEPKQQALCLKRQLKPYQMYLLYFFLYAMIGWIMETIYAALVLGGFHKRGFLLGPICPLYGFGALMLITFLGKYRENKTKTFLIAGVLFSVFEYITGYALDALFKLKFWDYTNDFLNLNGRISILYSVAWGVIAILFLNYLHPHVEKKVNSVLTKIPYKIQVSLIALLSTLFLVDLVFSCIKYLTLS